MFTRIIQDSLQSFHTLESTSTINELLSSHWSCVMFLLRTSNTFTLTDQNVKPHQEPAIFFNILLKINLSCYIKLFLQKYPFYFCQSLLDHLLSEGRWQDRHFLCGACMSFLCTCGSSPGTSVSSHRPKYANW